MTSEIAPTDAQRRATRTTGGALIVRLIVGAMGAAVIAYGVYLVFHGGSGSPPLLLAIWVIALLIAHDAILVPVVTLIGYLLTRFLPTYVRVPVQVGLIVAGSVALMSVAVLKAPGNSTNPTLLPYNYPVTLSIVLAIIAAVTALVVIVKVLKVRRASSPRT